MAYLRFETIGIWLTAAACAVAVSLVRAQPHAAHISFRPQAAPLAIRAPQNMMQPVAGAPTMYQTAHAARPERGGRPAAAPRGSHARGARLVARPPAGPARLPYRAVSQDARNVQPTLGASSYMRAGSIRDAVTRYNEERVTSRPLPRPPGQSSRLPDPSLYRN